LGSVLRIPQATQSAACGTVPLLRLRPPRHARPLPRVRGDPDEGNGMRRRLPLVLALLLPLACASMWVRSCWRYDKSSRAGVIVLSESGSVYVYEMQMPDELYSGRVHNNVLEVESGVPHHFLWPAQTWMYSSPYVPPARTWALRWWFITALSALPVWWAWRRRWREETPGFNVQPDADRTGQC
jgi:hypothetical protein